MGKAGEAIIGKVYLRCSYCGAKIERSKNQKRETYSCFECQRKRKNKNALERKRKARLKKL